jgi:hypothetical protein
MNDSIDALDAQLVTVSGQRDEQTLCPSGLSLEQGSSDRSASAVCCCIVC